MAHQKFLREAAKFAAGLVTGDFLVGWWVLASHLLPATFFGLQFDAPLVSLWMGFDVLLFLVLVFYAWHPKSMEPEFPQRMLFLAVGTIIGLVALIHILRLAFGWTVVIGDWTAPMWLSWVGVVVAVFISYTSFHFAFSKRR